MSTRTRRGDLLTKVCGHIFRPRWVRSEEIITEAEHQAKQQGVTVDLFVIGYLAALAAGFKAGIKAYRNRMNRMNAIDTWNVDCFGVAAGKYKCATSIKLSPWQRAGLSYDMMRIKMNEGVLFLIAGAVIFVISSFIRRVAKRAKTMSSIPRYSNTIKRASVSADIYTEHGMVDKDSSVRPQMKRSGSYYETLLLGCWL